MQSLVSGLVLSLRLYVCVVDQFYSMRHCGLHVSDLRSVLQSLLYFEEEDTRIFLTGQSSSAVIKSQKLQTKTSRAKPGSHSAYTCNVYLSPTNITNFKHEWTSTGEHGKTTNMREGEGHPSFSSLRCYIQTKKTMDVSSARPGFSDAPVYKDETYI